MKTYEILLHRPAVNDYIAGRINGVIYALSGMPEKGYPIRWEELDVMMRFDATESLSKLIAETIDKLYPKAFCGCREVE